MLTNSAHTIISSWQLPSFLGGHINIIIYWVKVSGQSLPKTLL